MMVDSFRFDKDVNENNIKNFDVKTERSIDIIKKIIKEKLKSNSILDKFYFLEGRTGSGKSTYLVSELYKEFIRPTNKNSAIHVVEPKVILTQSNAVNICRNNADIIMTKNIGYLSSQYKVQPEDKQKIVFMTTEIFKQKLLTGLVSNSYIADIVILDEVHILDLPMITLLNSIYEYFKNYIGPDKKINQEMLKKIPLFIFTSATINIKMLVEYYLKLFNTDIDKIYKDYLMIGYVMGKRNFDVETFYIDNEKLKQTLTKKISEKENKKNLEFKAMAQWVSEYLLPLADKSESTLKVKNPDGTEKFIPCKDCLIFFPITRFFNNLYEELCNLIKIPFIFVDNKITQNEFDTWRTNNRGKKRYVIMGYASGYSNVSNELLKFPVDPDREANMNEIKLVLTTPAIETGKTIATLYICADTGLQFNQVYSPLDYKVGEFCGQLIPISKKSVIQRMGRVGREAPGIFTPYYSKQTFELLDDDTLPDNINTVSLAGIYADNIKIFIKNKQEKRLDIATKNNYIEPNTIDTLIRTGQDLINSLYLTPILTYTNINNINSRCNACLIYAKYLYYVHGYKLFDALFIARMNRKFLPAVLSPSKVKLQYDLSVINNFDKLNSSEQSEVIDSIAEAKDMVNITLYNRLDSLFIRIKNMV